MQLGNLSLQTVRYNVKRLEFVIENRLHIIPVQTRFRGLIPPTGWTTIVTDYISTPDHYCENDECRTVINFYAEVSDQQVRLEQEISIERFPGGQPLGNRIKVLNYEKIEDA